MLGIVTQAASAAKNAPKLRFMSSSLVLTLVFAVAIAAGLLLKFWLASRQIRYVARHRDGVPAAFAQTVTLAAHQKAADYTVAKARFGLLEMALGAVVLLGWTLLGGLQALNQWLLSWLGGGMLQQLALLAAFAGMHESMARPRPSFTPPAPSCVSLDRP